MDLATNQRRADALHRGEAVTFLRRCSGQTRMKVTARESNGDGDEESPTMRSRSRRACLVGSRAWALALKSPCKIHEG